MKLNKILQKIALENGVSVAEVRKDIQEALDLGWNNPDPKVQEYWKSIPCRGKMPKLEEVIKHILKTVK